MTASHFFVVVTDRFGSFPVRSARFFVDHVWGDFVGHVLVMCGVIFAGHVWGDFCWPCVGDVWGDFCW